MLCMSPCVMATAPTAVAIEEVGPCVASIVVVAVEKVHRFFMILSSELDHSV